MPKEPVFSVWFKGAELRGTRSEFRRLINDAEEALSRATEICDMKPPVVDRGTLSYDSVKDFFRQAYPDRSLLGSRVTPLYKQLVRAAKDGQGLTARCIVCGSNPTITFCNDNKPHSKHFERFTIDIVSIKRFAPSVIKEKVRPRNFGPGMINDLKALVEKL